MKKIPLLVILFIPITLIIATLFIFHFVSNDTVQYSVLGYNFFHNGIFNDPYGVVPGWMQSPGWPFLLGLFSYFLPIQVLAPIGSLAITLLIILLFYYIIKQYFSAMLAWLTIGILILNPEFLIIGRSGLSEPFYLFVHLIIFSLLYKAWFKEKKFSNQSIIILAILSLMLLFIRSEGILYIPLIFYVIVKRFNPDTENKTQNKQPVIIAGIIYFVILTIVLIPYGNWIKTKSGQFNITPKIMFNARIGNVARLLSRVHGLDSHNPDLMEELAWYGLDDNRNELYSEHILDDTYYKNLVDQFHGEKNAWKRLFSLLLKNTKETIRVLIRSNPFPVFFVLLIFIGLFYLFKENKKKIIFISIWIFPSFYFLISHVNERFFYVILPYLSFIAAYGVYSVAQKNKKPYLLYNLALLLLFLNASLYYKAYYQKLQENEVYYQVAQEIKQTIPQEAKLCVKNFQPTFFSGNGFVKMPYCSVNELYLYLKKNETSYLVLGKEVNDFRKSFKPIFDQQQMDRFQWIKTYSTPYQVFKIFKVIGGE